MDENTKGIGGPDTPAGAEAFSEGFLEDQELLARHRAGDPKAYGQLFAKHRRRAFAFANQYTRSADQSEDLVIEAFTKILTTISRGKGPTISMGHYLASTIRTIAVNESKEDKHEFTLDPQEVAELYEREQFAEHKDPAMPFNTAGWLSDAFNSLDTREQEVLWLRAVENMPSKEIAAIVGVSPSTATRLFRSATQMLREKFVVLSLSSAPTAECESFRAQLVELTREDRPRKHWDLPEGALGEHLESCLYCRTLVARLGATDRVLLSIVFLAGLGALAADALRTAPPASAETLASRFMSSLATPLKIALLALPFVAVGIGALAFFASSQASEQVPSVTLAEQAPGSTSTLFRVGSCELIRVSVDNHSELWRLSSEDEECGVKIEYQGTDLILDTAVIPDMRAVEITHAGTYTIALSEGAKTQRLAISVAP